MYFTSKSSPTLPHLHLHKCFGVNIPLHYYPYPPHIGPYSHPSFKCPFLNVSILNRQLVSAPTWLCCSGGADSDCKLQGGSASTLTSISDNILKEKTYCFAWERWKHQDSSCLKGRLEFTNSYKSFMTANEMLEIPHLKKNIILGFYTNFQLWLYLCTALGSCKEEEDQFSWMFLYHVQYEYSNGSYQ